MRRAILLVTALATALALAVPVGAVGPDSRPDQASGENRARLVVLFETPSVTQALGVVNGSQADAHRAQLATERAEFADWLAANAPNAEIVVEYDTVLNGVSVELNGTGAGVIAAAPGVRQVMHPMWMSPTMDRSLPLIEWGAATNQDFTAADQSAGEGVLVGIIDTGIDHNHPFFDDDSTLFKDGETCKYEVDDPGDTDFTNCKVIVAKVFNADPSFTAQDFFGHGTHVAGTVGGVSGTANQFNNPMSGVAPGSVLGNYNVFPGETGSASSDDIADGVDEAVADGMDVLNLSLGGTPLGPRWDVLDLALLRAADVGVISAVAAGNSGPGEQTIQSPGWTPWVITAGASTNLHFPGQIVDEVTTLDPMGAAVGDFLSFGDDPSTDDLETGTVTEGYFSWNTVFGGDGEACERRAPSPSAETSGNIALIKRGTCTFTTKVRNAEAAGAVGVVVYNNVAGDPVAMGHDGTDPFPTIPAVMVSDVDGADLEGLAPGTVTAGGPIEDQDGTADIMAGFSSRGPTPNSPEGLLLKPDMVAPGVNVNSSIPCAGDGVCGDDDWAFFQGTSMATPHLAGSAAAIIWDRSWHDQVATVGNVRDEIVKSLLTNNALDGVVTSHLDGTTLVGVLDEGAGRLLLNDAFAGSYFADPVSISMGQIRGSLTASGTTTLAAVPGDTASGFDVESSTNSAAAAGVTVTTEIVGDVLTVTVTRPRSFRGDVEGVVIVSSEQGDLILVPYWVRF